MADILNNSIHLCISCSYDYPECPENCEVMFGDGAGNDNICCCSCYEPLWTKEMMERHISEKVGMTEAEELRELRWVCEPINFHCMDFQHAEKILTYAGIGCDVLSPDGFIHWLKQQMIKDPRFMDELKRKDVKPE